MRGCAGGREGGKCAQRAAAAAPALQLMPWPAAALQAGMPELSKLLSLAWKEVGDAEKAEYGAKAKVGARGWRGRGIRLQAVDCR